MCSDTFTPEPYHAKAKEDLQTFGYSCEKSHHDLTCYVADLLYEIDRLRIAIREVKHR